MTLLSIEQLLETNCLTESSKRYWSCLADDSSAMIANVKSEFRFAVHQQNIIPISINEAEYENSYVCSTYNGVITYPLQEIKLLPSWVQRSLVAGLIHSVAPLLRLCKINQAVVVNNWLLSTNLYPQLDLNWLDQTLELLKTQFPRHAILFRSLNDATNERLLRHLKNSGYLLVPSRQVYMVDGKSPDYLHHRHNNVIDGKLLRRQSDFRIVHHDLLGKSDYLRMQQLYDWLYLDRYSRDNPQFTARLMQLWHETEQLKFFGLRSAGGSLDGIVGLLECQGAVTLPVVGYDTSQPKSAGLYRRLMAIALREANNHRLTLNLSSGAASFKRLRGGQPQIEYTAVACEHLPLRQRAAWKSLSKLLQSVAVPLLQRYEL